MNVEELIAEGEKYDMYFPHSLVKYVVDNPARSGIGEYDGTEYMLRESSWPCRTAKVLNRYAQSGEKFLVFDFASFRAKLERCPRKKCRKVKR